MAEVTFQHIKHYVYLLLLMPGADTPVANTYPNCHYRWHGDTLQIIPDGANLPKASYHKSVVMVSEEHGEAPRYIPPGTPVRGALAPPPAIPDAEQTQVMTPVPAPSVESAQERMERLVRNLPAPTVEGMHNAHEAGQRHEGPGRRYRESGEASRTPADRADTGTSVAFAKEKDKDFEKEQDDEIAKLRPQTPPTPKPEPKPDNKFFSEAQSGSAINQTSDSPKVSGWQALKQMVLGKSDDQEIILGREKSEKSQSGISHRRVGGAHRTNYFLGYKNAPKRYARRFLQKPSVRAAFLAFVMFNAPTPVYVEN